MAKIKNLGLVLGVSLCLGIAARVLPAYAQQIDRTQLPIPDTQYKYPGQSSAGRARRKVSADRATPAAQGCAQRGRNSAR